MITHTITHIHTFQLQLALDTLMGNLGSRAEQELASRIVRLVVAGSTIGKRRL